LRKGLDKALPLEGEVNMKDKPEFVFLGREDPLEKGNGYPLQYSCLENPHG